MSDGTQPMAAFVRHPSIEKDIKRLGKHYPAPSESLEAWERLAAAVGLNGFASHCARYPGLGAHIVFKARVQALKEKHGKSSAYRLIFRKTDDGEQYEFLVLTRHEEYKNERDLIALVKERLS